MSSSWKCLLISSLYVLEGGIIAFIFELVMLCSLCKEWDLNTSSILCHFTLAQVSFAMKTLEFDVALLQLSQIIEIAFEVQ